MKLSESLFSLLYHLVFAAPLSASALFSQADLPTDSSCHSDDAAGAHDAAAEAYGANPAVVWHVSVITERGGVGFDRRSLVELQGLQYYVCLNKLKMLHTELVILLI